MKAALPAAIIFFLTIVRIDVIFVKIKMKNFVIFYRMIFEMCRTVSLY